MEDDEFPFFRHQTAHFAGNADYLAQVLVTLLKSKGVSMPTRDIKATRSFRRKVIFVFLSCAVSLVLAWIISRVAFTEIMDTVESITTPEPKLEIVSGISRDIMRLDQLQRAQAFGGNAAYRSDKRRVGKGWGSRFKCRWWP